MGSTKFTIPFVKEFYFRGDEIYNSWYISWGKFGFYWIMNLLGFTFVNIVNLQNVRKCPILDQHMSPASFYKTALIVAPWLFIESMNVNLRGKYDLSGSAAMAVPFDVA